MSSTQSPQFSSNQSSINKTYYQANSNWPGKRQQQGGSRACNISNGDFIIAISGF